MTPAIIKDRNADYARARIAEMEAEGTNGPARKHMAEIVLMRAEVGRYDESALQVWRDYLGSFK
jgi:hypothetical protein